MSPAKASDKDYRFDDSPQVPCTERHTLETVAVYPLASPAPELALEQLADRDQEGRLFIGTLILEDPDSYPPRGNCASKGTTVKSHSATQPTKVWRCGCCGGLPPTWGTTRASGRAHAVCTVLTGRTCRRCGEGGQAEHRTFGDIAHGPWPGWRAIVLLTYSSADARTTTLKCLSRRGSWATCSNTEIMRLLVGIR